MRFRHTALIAAATCALVATIASGQDQQPNQNQQTDTKQQAETPQRRPAALKVGQLAPLFQVKTLDGTATFDLKEFRGQKPVILFFGSYT